MFEGFLLFDALSVLEGKSKLDIIEKTYQIYTSKYYGKCLTLFTSQIWKERKTIHHFIPVSMFLRPSKVSWFLQSDFWVLLLVRGQLAKVKM